MCAVLCDVCWVYLESLQDAQNVLQRMFRLKVALSPIVADMKQLREAGVCVFCRLRRVGRLLLLRKK